MVSFLLKLDFEKACDSINWDYIVETLETIDFVPKWGEWIRMWLELAKVNILINGEIGKEIACR